MANVGMRAPGGFKREQWRDFVLARIQRIEAVKPAGQLPADSEWNERIQIRLVPASNLSASQRATVEREFNMTNGCLQVCLPRAMLIYAKRRWGLERPGARFGIGSAIKLSFQRRS